MGPAPVISCRRQQYLGISGSESFFSRDCGLKIGQWIDHFDPENILRT
jgi:hypothetical protein